MRNGNTKKLKRISEGTLLVTVDMGKVKHTGYYRFPDGAEGKIFEFSNSRNGFEDMWQRVCHAKKSRNLTEVVVGFEPTGPYAEPLLHFLRNRNVRLVQVNPFHTKRLKELQGNSPSKTDQKDPKVIADIIELGHALTVIIPEGTAAELRRLTQARERSIQRMSMLMNQLQDLVFLIFPEFMPLMKNITSRSTHYLLKNCPRPKDILEKGVETLAISLKDVSRGHFGRMRAEDLCRVAWESVGIAEGSESIAFEIQESVAMIEKIEQFVKELEKHMSKHLKDIPYSRFILSIKGIGEITTAGLIGEMGDFKKYHTIGEVIKHAGLDLFEISSGKHKGTRRISKRGRPLLRKLLFFASMNVVRKGGILHKQYLRHLDKGMPKIKALIAISRKLLSIIFALVRNHSVYIDQYSKIQQLKEAA
ncbi:MAG: IS110 family transposase [Candidatus Omnitrophota bacterium]